MSTGNERMVTIRRAQPTDARAIATVHVESWRTTYQGIVPASFLNALSVEVRERFWERTIGDPSSRTSVVVASDDNQIIGFASGGPPQDGRDERTGELHAIYLLQHYQRGGIGRRLTHAIVDHLIHHGFSSMLVWVLAENPSRHYYEALGGELLETKSIEIGGVMLEEVAYRWSDLTRIAERLRQPGQ